MVLSGIDLKMTVNKLKYIFHTIWVHSIGSVIYYLPLFVATVVLLSPGCFNPDEPLSYFTGLSNLFAFDAEFGDHFIRNDLYYVIGIASVSCVLVSLLTRTHVPTFLRSVWYALLIVTFITRRFLLWTFDTDINAETISMMLETNSDEVTGFVQSFLLTWQVVKYIIKALLIAVLIVASECLWKKYRQRIIDSQNAIFGSTLVVLVLMPFAIMSASTYKYLDWVPVQNTVSSVVIAFDGIKAKTEEAMFFYTTVERTDKEIPAVAGDDTLDVVFVIGESFIRSHASIYGYVMPTTPCMKSEEKKGNLIAYSDVMSPFNATTLAMKNMLSLNHLTADEKWNRYAFWPQIFRKAGFATLVFDNQRGDDRHYSGSFYEMYSSKVTSVCFDCVANDQWHFDHEMPPYVEEELSKRNKRTFFLMHLWGQHFHFAQRYPKEAAVFSATDIKRKEAWITNEKRQLIADYDNAVHLTDKTLGMLFDLFRNRCAVLVFVSDHGEEVYDYRDRTNRPGMDKTMKTSYARSQHSTPFVVWMSDRYKATYPDVVKAVEQAKDRPYCHDLVGQMMLTLGRVKSSHYRSEDDVLSAGYKPGKRFIYVGNQKLDYDSLMRSRE